MQIPNPLPKGFLNSGEMAGIVAGVGAGAAVLFGSVVPKFAGTWTEIILAVAFLLAALYIKVDHASYALAGAAAIFGLQGILAKVAPQYSLIQGSAAGGTRTAYAGSSVGY